jgi:hypothetical protein
VVAFTADLLGLYIKQPAQWVAVLIYNGVLVICCVCYNALWWYAAKGARLLSPTLHPEVVRQTTRRYAWPPFLYLLAFLLSSPLFWNGTPGLILCLLLILVYLLPVYADRVKLKRR